MNQLANCNRRQVAPGKGNMKKWIPIPLMMLGMALLLQTGCVVPAPPGLPPPPVPVVEFDAEPPPFPGAVWVGGSWGWHADHNRYEWHHGEWRH